LADVLVVTGLSEPRRGSLLQWVGTNEF